MQLMTKKLCVALAVLLGVGALHAQKTRMGQEMPFVKPGVNYPVVVHVYGIHVRPDCTEGYCVNTLYADVVAIGRKLELGCATGIPEKPYFKKGAPLSFGNFHARVLRNGSGTALGDEYELVLPNKRVLGCVVSGMLK